MGAPEERTEVGRSAIVSAPAVPSGGSDATVEYGLYEVEDGLLVRGVDAYGGLVSEVVVRDDGAGLTELALWSGGVQSTVLLRDGTELIEAPDPATADAAVALLASAAASLEQAAAPPGGAAITPPCWSVKLALAVVCMAAAAGAICTFATLGACAVFSGGFAPYVAGVGAGVCLSPLLSGKPLNCY